MRPRIAVPLSSIMVAGLTLASLAHAKPEIRASFYAVHPDLVGTRLETLPSVSNHCGMCHWKFTGTGPRNPYGVRVQEALNGFPNDEAGRQAAISGMADIDADGDGFLNSTEMYDISGYSNTPTFPGLKAGSVGSVTNVNLADILPYLTPEMVVDTDPPLVSVTGPDGGEAIGANTTTAVTWTATDLSGVGVVEISFSDDGGLTWMPLAHNLGNVGSWSWFVPNRPGGSNLVRVEALDNAGNWGSDTSGGPFTIIGLPAGYVPTTLRDMDLDGTQPLEGAVLADPDLDCVACHGNYDTANEPYANWRGSMMGNAARDPLMLACLAVAEQDAPSVGDLCLRCHTPGGWQEGRSTDTSGGQISAKDRAGVQCDFCHRAVDPNYVEGISPIEDVDVLATVSPLPLQYANGQFINDPGAAKRGPFSDPLEVGHTAIHSPFHREADLCGTCHDVSNPVYEQFSLLDYVPTAFDAGHPTQDLRNMFPVERTFSEWQNSEYATTGVYAPQFAGNKPDGIVATCQDCHMADVFAAGSNQPGSPLRPDLPLHDLTGGNTFIPDILPDFYPNEVDVAQLQAAKARATAMLQKAATLEVSADSQGVIVRVINETGHKLISGYPEGRRMWLNVRAYDASAVLVYESAHYDTSTAELTHDADAKIYEIKPGISHSLSAIIGLPAGPSFHFVLNDTVWSDNRIPPRGFTNAAYELIQSPPVGHVYEDGQYWDDTFYELPPTAKTVTAQLLYQTVSREYVEFLRDENTTNTAGLDLYTAWQNHGMSRPVVMAEETLVLDPAAGITAIQDVPNDQGRNIRLVWNRSLYDRADDGVVVTGYTLLRRQDAVKNQKLAGWDTVTWIPADYSDVYQFVAPTLCDSTAGSGICWSVFMIRTHSDDPGVFFDSPPDSGYSVDNLEPAVPAGLHFSSPALLAWSPVPDADFAYYTVFGSMTGALDGNQVLVGYTTGTELAVTGDPHPYYLVTATDFAGNQGGAAAVQNPLSDVGDRLPAVREFALMDANPNPFNPMTTIRFELPRDAGVTLRIYDLSGRLVRTLAGGERFAAGRHEAIWDGRDDSGRGLPSGMYFYRLEAADFVLTKKMMLVK